MKMIVLKKRSIIIVSMLLLTAITFIVCFSALVSVGAGEASATGIKVVIDAGHGGIDVGVCGVKTGVKESEINLSISKKLERYLLDAGISVVLTRSSDAGLYGVASSSLKKKDMQKRRDIIHSAKPDLVVSIHQNEFSLSSRRGAQVFYKGSDELGKILATSVQTSFNEMEEASRSCSALKGDYYILNCSNYPSIIAECGFLSNPQDEALLISEEYQDKIAYAIFKGIISYLTKTSSKLTPDFAK